MSRLSFDDTFLNAYDAIMFGSLCDSSDPNCTVVLQDGLNLHYSLYIYYIEDKLTNFTTYSADKNQTLYALMVSPSTLQQECIRKL